LMVLMLGVGVQITTGVANGLANSTQQAIGTAVPGVILILIACVAPVALFKLLAFIDPNTGSGAALRAGLADAGGLRGLLGDHGVETDGQPGNRGDARSEGEVASEDSTNSRLTQAQGSLLRGVGGAAGGAAASAVQVAQLVGTRVTAIGSDITNQLGVGHPSYHPDLSNRVIMGRRGGVMNGSGGDDVGDPERPEGGHGPDGSPSAQNTQPPPSSTSEPEPSRREPSPVTGKPPGSAGSLSTGSAERAGPGASAAAAGEATAAVPIVPA